MRHWSLAILFGGWGGVSLAQCGSCTVVDTCFVDPPFPTVCPATPPPATVGVPFSLDVTFWIPPSFAEPTTQLNVVLDEVTLNSLENIPLGLTYSVSSPTLTFYPQQDPFGCVRVCGVPMEAGSDTIRIHVTAQGTVGGIATTQPYDLALPIVVLPADLDSVPDFSAAPVEGCEPLPVALEALLSPQGLVTTYEWDLGNGTTYSGPAPPEQTYSAGSHTVTLQTIVSGSFLTQLTISGVNEDWCGDIDEPDLPFIGCVGQPDLYFTVLDGRYGLSRSAVASNTQSHTWSNLRIPLGFPPFTLRVYDQDGTSDDDLLGSFSFDASVGSFSFSQGGTAGQGNVQVLPVQAFSYVDTITVLPSPNTTLDLNITAGALCAADMGLASYAWQLNGIPVAGEEGPCVLASNGVWTVTGTSPNGCSASSSYNVIGLGVEDVSDPYPMTLFPMPNDGRFVLRLAGMQATDAYATLFIHDATGRLVHSERSLIRQGELTVALSNLPPGSYTAKLAEGGRTITRPFMVVDR